MSLLSISALDKDTSLESLLSRVLSPQFLWMCLHWNLTRIKLMVPIDEERPVASTMRVVGCPTLSVALVNVDQ
jgi:hypothetical protein